MLPMIPSTPHLFPSYEWNGQLKCLRALKFTYRVAETVTRQESPNPVSSRLKYLRYNKVFYLFDLCSLLVRKANRIIRYTNRFHKSVKTLEYGINCSGFLRASQFNYLKNVSLDLNNTFTLSKKPLKRAQLKSIFHSRTVESLSINSFDEFTFLLLKNYPKLKNIYFTCSIKEFVSGYNSLQHILLSKRRSPMPKVSINLEVNENLKPSSRPFPINLENISAFSIHNSFPHEIIPHLVGLNTCLSTLEKFSYKGFKSCISREFFEGFNSLKDLELSIYHSLTQEPKDPLTHFTSMILPPSLEKIRIELTLVGSFFYKDLIPDSDMFKNLLTLSRLKSFHFKLAVYGFSDGKNIGFLKIMKEILTFLNSDLQSLNLSFFDTTFTPLYTCEKDLFGLLNKFQKLKDLNMELPIKFWVERQDSTQILNPNLESLVLNDCRWFLEFLRKANFKSIRVLKIASTEKLSSAELQSLFKLVKNFASLRVICLTFYLHEKISISEAFCNEIVDFIKGFKLIRNLQIKLPNVLLGEKQAEDIYYILKWKKYLENSFLLLGNYEFVRRSLNLCCYSKTHT